LVLGAAASGVLALCALVGAGSANASCVSFSGLNSGNGGTGKCTTTSFGDTAIGIGNTDVVEASGGFNTSIAVGAGADASATGGQFNTAIAIGNEGYNEDVGSVVPATATAVGSGNSSIALGNGAAAQTRGILNHATVIGDGSTALAFGDRFGHPGVLNSAFVLGNKSTAVVFGGNTTSGLKGIGNNSAVVLGNNSLAEVNGAPGTDKRNQIAVALGSNKTADR
jgi:hypothetical protein